MKKFRTTFPSWILKLRWWDEAWRAPPPSPAHRNLGLVGGQVRFKSDGSFRRALRSLGVFSNLSDAGASLKVYKVHSWALA